MISGWNAPSIDFKSLSLNMGVGSKSSSSSQNMTGAMPQEQEPNSLNMSLGVVVEKSITDERLCAATRADRTHTSHNTHVLLQQLALTRRIRGRYSSDFSILLTPWTCHFENTAHKKPLMFDSNSHNSFSRKRELSLEKTSSLPNKKAVYADSSLDPPRSLPMMTVPPPATMTASSATSTFGQLANQITPETAHMTMCPCCLNTVSPAERFCMVCGACLQWT